MELEPEAQTAPTPANGLNSHHSHEVAFVRPSDLLRRPRTISRPITPVAPPPPKPEKPIDRDEREALVCKPSFTRSIAGYQQQRHRSAEPHFHLPSYPSTDGSHVGRMKTDSAYCSDRVQYANSLSSAPATMSSLSASDSSTSTPP
jgi:hypothetical protein